MCSIQCKLRLRPGTTKDILVVPGYHQYTIVSILRLSINRPIILKNANIGMKRAGQTISETMKQKQYERIKPFFCKNVLLFMICIKIQHIKSAGHVKEVSGTVEMKVRINPFTEIAFSGPSTIGSHLITEPFIWKIH